MTTSVRKRTNGIWFLTIVIASAITMVWLFWHFPLMTGIVTIVILAVFGVSARLAQWIDSDGMAELKRLKQRA